MHKILKYIDFSSKNSIFMFSDRSNNLFYVNGYDLRVGDLGTPGGILFDICYVTEIIIDHNSNRFFDMNFKSVRTNHTNMLLHGRCTKLKFMKIDNKIGVGTRETVQDVLLLQETVNVYK